MNFLAHLYLSGDNEDIMIGNFIGDFVKGKAHENYNSEIQKGILLHREIDSFTDSHEVVMKTKERLRPKYHHYAPVIADVFYDHFLARLWSNYHQKTLLAFTEDFYKTTNRYMHIFPAHAANVLSYMKRDNWLYNYQFVKGIDRALTGMAGRTPYDSKMEEASADLEKDYEKYQKEFILFFPDLKSHVENILTS